MWKRALICFVAIHAGRAGIAWACSCAWPFVPGGGADTGWDYQVDDESVVDSAWLDVENVVHVQVTDTRWAMGCGTRKTDFDVLESFKGAESGSSMRLRHGTNGASCGVQFEEGEEYLLFTDGEEIDLCSAVALGGDDTDAMLAAVRRSL